ncbi:MAG: hypothetical protein ABIQ16_25370 [Polyangiaceae bacterium]
MRAASADALITGRAGWLALAFAGLIAACGGDSPSSKGEHSPIAECMVEAPTSCPDPATTYADVVDIFTSKCVSCHYGAAGGPWPLTNYDDVADWKDTVRDDVLDCSMPPPDSGVTLSSGERSAILTWVRCGALE